MSGQTIQDHDTLTLSFPPDEARCRGYYGSSYYLPCQRNLGLEGKKATAGVIVTPPVDGVWRWTSDYSLDFTPSGYWRAGQAYTVTLNLDQLGVPKAEIMNGALRRATVTFTTAPLAVSISDMKYFQDPDDPARKLVSAHLGVNYPVAPAALDPKIHSEFETPEDGKLAAAPNVAAPEIKHDADGEGAWLTLPLSGLPEAERFLRLIVDAGVVPLHGGTPSPDQAHERVRIPSLTTFLEVSDATATIARLPDDTPQQTLSFQTNVKARPDEALKHLQLYLLPAQHPVTKLSHDKKTDKLYQWKADNEVTPEILQQSERLSLTPMANADQFVTQFGFPISAPSGRYLYFVADKDFPAFGGYKLGRPSGTILQAPDWPHDLDIMQQGSILTLSGAKKLSLHARGADLLKVEVAHIRPEALQHFISQTDGDIRDPYFTGENFGKEDISRIDSVTLPLNYRSPQESEYAAFDFAPYLKNNAKGVFLLSIQGYKDGKAEGRAVTRFVLVTDFGLLVKDNARQGRDVFVMSFTSGQPVAGAGVTVIGRNGLAIFKGVAGADGHIALPLFGDAAKDRAPVAIVAQKAGDFAFIPYNRDDRALNFSKFDIRGSVAPAEGLRALLFSDRGIYRPGETAHLGALLRNADWSALPPGLPLRFVVTDPRGRKIRQEIMRFSDPGLAETSLATDEASPTGTYHANLYIAKDDENGSLLGSVSFRVEEFQPDRLKIKTVFVSKDGKPVRAEGWAKPEDLRASVTLTNLYGTPASDRRLTGAVTLNQGSLDFDKFKDWHFYDADAAKPDTVQYDLPEAKTDAAGTATLALDLEHRDPATYSLNLQTRGFEAGSGRGVTAYSTIMVSPMDTVIGYRTNAKLDYLRQGQAYRLDLLALDRHLAPAAVPGLTLALVHKTYISSLVKHDDGSYAYESVAKEEDVKDTPFAIAAGGTSLDLPADTLGDFIYRVEDAKKKVVEEIPFSIVGEGEQATGADREAVLKASIDKDTYGPGENIELHMSAPYTGAGLITLESDHVIAHKWFRTKTTDTVQTIAIPKDFSGKGYVSIAFVRDINSHEIYLSPLSYAVVPFAANLAARTAPVALDLPATVKPGMPVTVHYHGNAPGKVVIYAVDEGILQIAKYKTPDPVHFFLLDRALEVRTLQMLDLLMPEYALVRELSHIGGDEAEKSVLGKHLNPFKRKTLAPAIFWSGIVDLGTADRTVTFTPPGHFNGEMRVMAVAATASGVGSAESKLTVRGDIVVTPNVPVFLAPGDTANVSATVANNLPHSGRDAKLTVAVAAQGGLTVTPAPLVVAVPEGQERTVDFTLRATDNPGPASVFVTAGNGHVVQKAEATLSVRPALTKETTLTGGYAEKGSAGVALSRRLYTPFAERRVSVSPLPTAYIYGLLKYLDEYPYGCSEQIVSTTLPQLSLYGRPEFMHDDDRTKAKVDDTVETLSRRQTTDGGFSFWDGENDANLFVTAYALDFLNRAQGESLPVPSELVENGLRYLRNHVNQDIKSDDDARIKAYGIYVLTENGIVTSNEILHLLKYFDDAKETDWQTDLTAVYIASSYQLMQQGALANETLDRFERGALAADVKYDQHAWDDGFYNPFIKYARYVSLLARHFPDRVQRLDPHIVYRLATFVQEQRYNTLSSAFAIQALVDYQTVAGKALAAQPIRISADGKALSASSAAGITDASLPVSASALQIAGAGSPLFYTVAETGFDRALPKDAVEDNMEIDRSYQTIDGKPIKGSVALGDVVEAVIKIRSHGGNSIGNVAIVDLLPGGFDLDLDDTAPGSSLTPDFVDRREDRIIAFGTVEPQEEEFHYRLRATSKGTFTVPPPYAEAMYDPTTKARGHADTITVQDPK